MGGTIGVESALGSGTVVRVELPLTPSAGRRRRPSRRSCAARCPRARTPSARAASLLLVEDHPVNREILTRQLEALGFVTDTADDAEEALERFAAARYGLVFCDLLLPGADGYELARRLRALEHGHGRAAPRSSRSPPAPCAASANAAARRAWTTSSSSPRPRRRWPPRCAAVALAASRRRPRRLTLGTTIRHVVARYLQTLQAPTSTSSAGRSRQGEIALVRRVPTRSPARAGWSARTPSPSARRGSSSADEDELATPTRRGRLIRPRRPRPTSTSRSPTTA